MSVKTRNEINVNYIYVLREEILVIGGKFYAFDVILGDNQHYFLSKIWHFFFQSVEDL